MIRPGRPVCVALAAAAVALLSGCVYDVSDYGLETPGPTDAGSPTATPVVDEPPALDLPAGCAPADLSIDWAQPVVGAADQLLAVRVMQVRIPGPGEQPGLGSTPQSVTRTDTELVPPFGLAVDAAGDGSATVVDQLTPDPAWAGYLLGDLRDRDIVPPRFGRSIQLVSFDPVLDRAARYVIGYLGATQAVRFDVTGCDGTFRSSGALTGIDPMRYGGAVLLECGVPPGDQYDRWDLLEPYCADGAAGAAGTEP
ncbi:MULTISPECIES: hypothetical protein [Clavibacter]|uniref:Lipoprotein n=2 Tax=Clavibacter TaxID=1573 RepID=A0A399NWY6_9MICO|nr:MULTISPECIES: hypothetical protein [Clavibacter]KDP90682.1 hypothetical protein W824_14490 [Clavibacter cf. michiganensis LMG 26808]RII98291.1 hypothetical protein DZF96_03760 [Clavibacter michiganensis]UKF26202.1 hypothetical protein KYT88_05740 [Clavibacter sp. A6099]